MPAEAARPPPYLMEQVRGELVQLLSDEFQSLASRCVEACVHQVWAACLTSLAAAPQEVPLCNRGDAEADNATGPTTLQRTLPATVEVIAGGHTVQSDLTQKLRVTDMALEDLTRQPALQHPAVTMMSSDTSSSSSSSPSSAKGDDFEMVAAPPEVVDMLSTPEEVLSDAGHQAESEGNAIEATVLPEVADTSDLKEFISEGSSVHWQIQDNSDAGCRGLLAISVDGASTELSEAADAASVPAAVGCGASTELSEAAVAATVPAALDGGDSTELSKAAGATSVATASGDLTSAALSEAAEAATAAAAPICGECTELSEAAGAVSVAAASRDVTSAEASGAVEAATVSAASEAFAAVGDTNTRHSDATTPIFLQLEGRCKEQPSHPDSCSLNPLGSPGDNAALSRLAPADEELRRLADALPVENLALDDSLEPPTSTAGDAPCIDDTELAAMEVEDQAVPRHKGDTNIELDADEEQTVEQELEALQTVVEALTQQLTRLDSEAEIAAASVDSLTPVSRDSVASSCPAPGLQSDCLAAACPTSAVSTLCNLALCSEDFREERQHFEEWLNRVASVSSSLLDKRDHFKRLAGTPRRHGSLADGPAPADAPAATAPAATVRASTASRAVDSDCGVLDATADFGPADADADEEW